MSKKAAVEKKIARRLYKKGDHVRGKDHKLDGLVAEDENPDRTTGLVSVWWPGDTPEVCLHTTLQLCTEASPESIKAVEEVTKFEHDAKLVWTHFQATWMPTLHRNVISTEFSNKPKPTLYQAAMMPDPAGHDVQGGVDFSRGKSWSAQRLIPEDVLYAAVLEKDQPAREGSHVLVSPTEVVPAEEYNRSHGLVIKDSLMRSHAPADKPLTATLAQRGIQLPGQQRMIRGDKHLGHRMHDYHDNMSDPVYQVGSYFFAERPVPEEWARRALSSLHAFYKAHRTEHLRRVITDLETALAGGIAS